MVEINRQDFLLCNCNRFQLNIARLPVVINKCIANKFIVSKLEQQVKPKKHGSSIFVTLSSITPYSLLLLGGSEGELGHVFLLAYLVYKQKQR